MSGIISPATAIVSPATSIVSPAPSIVSPATSILSLTNLAPGFPGFASGWTATRSTLATGISGDPAGGSNAARITEDSTASNTHTLQTTATIAVAANGTYTCEVYTTPGSSGTRGTGIFFLDASGSNGFEIVANPSTGVITFTNTFGTGTLATSGSSAAANGWFKIWATGTLGNFTTANLFVALISSNTSTYNGDGTSNNLVYGPFVSLGTTVP